MEQGISVVIPVYNEEANVKELYLELRGVLLGYGRQFEIIFIDDGSRDKTVENLSEIALSDEFTKIIVFRRNFGQTAAMAAGLSATRFNIVVTMDGDRQNDPSEIPNMINVLESGYDLVAGWRAHRKDSFLSRKLPSKIANWLISRLTDVQLHDYGCTLKVMSGDIARGIKLYGEMHRFIPALAAEMGAKIAEVKVKHRARVAGTSKYGISRTFRVILDLLTVKFLLGYSKRPIHFFGSVGLFSTGIGIGILAFMTYQKFIFDINMANRPLMTLGVMLVIIGLQFFCFGLLAEVLARTYYESQNKPIYTVRRVIDFQSAEIPGNEESILWKRKIAN